MAQGSTTKWKWVYDCKIISLRYSLVPPVMVLVSRGFKYYTKNIVFESTKYRV
jgi:hypothetical protein